MRYVIAAVIICFSVLFFRKTVSAISHRLPEYSHIDDAEREIFSIISDGGRGRAASVDKRQIKRAFLRAKKASQTHKKISGCYKYFLNRYYDYLDLLRDYAKKFMLFKRLPKGREGARTEEILVAVLRSCEGLYSKENVKSALNKINIVDHIRYAELASAETAAAAAVLEYTAAVLHGFGETASMYGKGICDGRSGRMDLSLLRDPAYLCGLSGCAKGESARFVKSVCAENGISQADAEKAFETTCAEFSGRLSNAWDSMKLCGEMFDKETLLELSPVDSIMREAEGYCDADSDTRLLYLEEISLRARRDRIAETVAATEAAAESAREKKDIAFFVLKRPAGKTAMCGYILLCVLTTLALPAFIPFIWGIYAVAAYVVALPISLAFVRNAAAFVCSRLFRRRYLPLKRKEAFQSQKGLALITVVRLIADEAELREAFAHIETIKYANPQECFSYCLLLDFLNSQTDELSEAERKTAELARSLYGSLKDRDRYAVFVRKRVCAEKGFGGWEKKRGAIIELNAYITEKRERSGFYLRLGCVPDAVYNIVLDSDTLINNGVTLVAAAEHPFNKPYAVIGMHTRPTACSASGSRFAGVYGDGFGLDGYNQYVCDAHYDLFGKGNFTGKGLYRINEFYHATVNSFPDNRILSHDYIEGAFAGCAVGGFYGLDEFPENFSSYLTRNMRWQRGDIQLLPYLKRKVRNRDGKKIYNPITPVDKWHIFLNIALPFKPIAQICLTIAALFISPYLLFVAFFTEIIALISATRGAVLGYPAFNTFIRIFADVVYLPVTAWYSAITYAVTFCRLIRHKKLLDWKVFAHSKGRVNVYYSVIFAVILIGLNVWLSSGAVFYAAASLWLIAPLLDRYLSGRKRRAVYHNENFDALLYDVASRTVKYFDDQICFGLPCDNYAENTDMWAYRTSPTDIGMALVAYVCACELGVKTYAQVLERVSGIIGRIESAPKWRGHLYNWMDPELNVLPPRYISTVDSGNLMAALIAVENYFPELSERASQLIENTDMAALIDSRKGLFYIGYNESSGEFDRNHYDLIGSESVTAYIISAGLGKISAEVWYKLSHAKVRSEGFSLLYSWTGGMFEYLLGAAFFRYPSACGIGKTVRSAVKIHEKYTAGKSGIWGVSECQYTQTDNDGNYKYKAFGVPAIALSDVNDAEVAAPYASALALEFDPKPVYDNMRRIIGVGGYGGYGFYEAVGTGPVRSYMSHHQGMILAGICNYLKDNAVHDIMLRSPAVRAAEIFFHERMPGKGRRKRFSPAFPEEPEAEISVGEYKYPAVMLMGDRFKTVIDRSGNGYSVWGGKFIGRYLARGDGMRMYVKSGKYRCEPTKRAVRLSPESCVYEAETPEFRITASVMSVRETEYRAVKVKNKTDKTLGIELAAMIIPTLISREDYAAHPVFNDMFTETTDCRQFVTAKRADGKSDVVAGIKGTGGEATYFGNYAAYDGAPPEFGRTLSPAIGCILRKGLPPEEECVFGVCLTAGISDDDVGRKLGNAVSAVKSITVEAKTLSKNIAPSLSACALAARMLYGKSFLRSPVCGIDGRRPVMLCEYTEESETLVRLRDAAAVAAYMIPFDVAVIYKEDRSYYKETADRIENCVDESGLRGILLGTVAVINESENAVAAEILREAAVEENSPLPQLSAGSWKAHKPVGIELKPDYPVHCGGFIKDGSYLIDLAAPTPAPWSNVIADEKFGTLTAESGSLFSWFLNSREGKLTEFLNTAADFMPSEYIVYGESGALWSATAKPLRGNGSYYVRHGMGFTDYISDSNGLTVVEKHYIAIGKNAKIFSVSIENPLKRRRKLDIMACAVPVLGSFTGSSLCFSHGRNSVAALSSNGMKVVLSSEIALRSYAFHKEAYMRDGRFITNKELDDCGSDPALCCSVSVIVPPEGKCKILFALSADGYDFQAADDDSVKAEKHFGTLSDISVHTGDAEFDFLYRWLPYQTYCSRFYGRCGFYQVSGGYGFRDQLQDCLTMLYCDPSAVRRHIIDAAAHQFSAGDVMHWWHPPAIGVRTRICDDRLFLPLTVAEYVEYTGDFTILAERVPFLSDITLPDGEASVYSAAEFSSKTASILEHCKRAIEISCDTGAHGLVLMRGGDWNDAMDKAGENGIGESVWATMFLYYVIGRFCGILSDTELKLKYASVRKKLSDAIDSAWDDDRYIRLITDEGDIIGSPDSGECSLDLLTQAWAELSGACPEEKAYAALKTAFRLVDFRSGIVRLFDPPFIMNKNIGYIASYPPGVRENGGQYTHAAVWYVMALYAAGQNQTAYDVMSMLNPIKHGKKDGDNFRTEPYALPADVYSGRYAGRGGWSWYTGSASWLCKCMTEYTLGIVRRGKKLLLSPAPPSSWKKISVGYSFEYGTLTIIIDNTSDKGEWKILVDGIAYNTNEIALTKSVAGKTVSVKRVP